MADRYWVLVAGGTWDTNAGLKWSATSGGVGGASVPTASDNVFFDANSGVGTVTVSGTRSCLNLNCTGYAGTLSGSSSPVLAISAAATFSSGMTLTGAITILMNATTDNGGAGWGITTAGKTLSTLTLSGSGGRWKNLDAMAVTNNINLNAGTWETNNQSISANAFVLGTTGTRRMIFGSSAITITGGGTVWNATLTGTYTIDANTATVTFTNAGTVTWAGATDWNGLSVVVNAAVTSFTTPAGTLTVYNFTRTGPSTRTGTLNLAGDLIATNNMQLDGNSAINRLLVAGTIIGGTQRGLVCLGTLSGAHVDFRDVGVGTTIQYACPDATTSLGTFTVTGAATGHEATDDYGTTDDTAYISSVSGGSSTAEFTLSNVTDPQMEALHVIAVRAALTSAATSYQVTLVLKQGATTIATRTTGNLDSTPTNYEFSLTAAEANSITDYTNLSMEVTGFKISGVNRQVRIHSVAFYVATAIGSISGWTGGTGDCGGNGGATFTASSTQTWQGTSGGDASDVTKWTSRIPLPQDDVVVASAFAASQTISLDMPRCGRNWDFTGTTGSPAITTVTSVGTWSFFGSLTLATGVGTVTTATTAPIAFCGRGSHTVTTAGKSIGGSGAIQVAGGSSTVYTQQDAFTATVGWQLFSGGWDANDQSFTASSFALFSLGAPGTIWMGNGTWTTTTTTGTPWSAQTGTFTVNAEGSTIDITGATATGRTFSLGGYSYNIIKHTPAASSGSLGFTNMNGATVNRFNIQTTVAKTVTFFESQTLVVNDGAGSTFQGSSGQLLSLTSRVSGTPATVTMDDAVGRYLLVKDLDSDNSGGTNYAELSTNSGGNSGWLFDGTNATATPSVVATTSGVGSTSVLSTPDPATVVTTVSIGTPTVDFGAQDALVEPTVVATISSVGSASPLVNADVTPAAVDTVSSVPGPSVGTGEDVTSAAVATTSSVGSVAITVSDTVVAAVVATAAVVGSHSVTFEDQPSPAGISTTVAVGAPFISVEEQTSSAAIVTSSAVNSPQIRVDETIIEVSINTTTGIGTILVAAADTATGAAVETLTGIGSASVSTSSSATVSVVPTSVAIGLVAIDAHANAPTVGVVTITNIGSPNVVADVAISSPLVQTITTLFEPEVFTGGSGEFVRIKITVTFAERGLNVVAMERPMTVSAVEAVEVVSV